MAKLKITPDHIAHIAAAIAPFDTPTRRAEYKAAGFSDTRYGFDLLFIAKLSPWLCNDVYRYANDGHIASALRTIVKPL